MTAKVSLCVPGDPAQLTGGYRFDARLIQGLQSLGWSAKVFGLEGQFPIPDRCAREAMTKVLDDHPDDALVILDGLAMGAMPEVIGRHRNRLRLVALVHHPLGDEEGHDADAARRLHRLELEALSQVDQVVVTSRFTRQRLLVLSEREGVLCLPDIAVIEPGVDPAPLAVRSAEDTGPLRFICVASVIARKGFDVLVEALAKLAERDWRCDCYGSLARDPDYAREVLASAEQAGLGGRLVFHGECDQAALDTAYLNADFMVLASHYEGYGMVVTEALARGLGVICTTGGALADTLPDGAGLSVAPNDPDALADALASCLDDPRRRDRLRHGALKARSALTDWPTVAGQVATLLDSLGKGDHFEADWLALREPVDHASRSHALAEPAGRWLKACAAPVHLLDMGCGRGSNLIYLAPRLPGRQHWTLLDHDETLIKQAKARCQTLASADQSPVHLDVKCLSLEALLADWPCKVHLVTASALIDLVSAAWLEALVERCLAHRQALLVALSVTGDWALVPAVESDEDGDEESDEESDEDGDKGVESVEGEHSRGEGGRDLDARIQALFIAHQQRDKGFGKALGSQAHAYLVTLLEAAGFQVYQARTPWHLDPSRRDHRALLVPLIRGWALAAEQQAPAEGAQIKAWRDASLAEVEKGRLGAVVNHGDLLGLPPLDSGGV